MNRIELENLDILELRALGQKAGVQSQKKAAIVAALADEYRSGPPVAVSTQEDGSGAPSLAPPQAKTTTPEEDAVLWIEVDTAICPVNGEYVNPPWFDELQAAVTIGHVELMGPAGSGKTLAVQKLATLQGRRLAIITADGGLRKRDLVGQRELINGQTFFKASQFATAARDGDWALIDEANMAEASAMGFLNGMLDRPGTEGSTFLLDGRAIPVHPDFRLFITRNPGYRGTSPMNEALRDRFWSIEVPPLMGEALRQMLKAHSVPAKSIEGSAMVVEALYSAWEKNRISYQISPRRVIQTADIAKKLKGVLFEDLLRKSIMTKVDQKHDRDSVSQIITEVFRVIGFVNWDKK